MEELTTYEFYKGTYYGETIEETAFPKWLSRAGDKLALITHGNITEETRKEYDLQIQKAACALADLLYELDKAIKTANSKEMENVKSRSSGGESVTYGERETLVTKVLSDKNAQLRLMYDTVSEYLSGTGLLYAGY